MSDLIVIKLYNEWYKIRAQRYNKKLLSYRLMNQCEIVYNVDKDVMIKNRLHGTVGHTGLNDVIKMRLWFNEIPSFDHSQKEFNKLQNEYCHDRFS